MTFLDSLEYTPPPAMCSMDIKSLRSSFRGQILEPADDGYDAARQIWNASVDKRPGVIAQCSGVADVIAAVNFGREQSAERNSWRRAQRGRPRAL
jgi:hypothetical protein